MSRFCKRRLSRRPNFIGFDSTTDSRSGNQWLGVCAGHGRVQFGGPSGPIVAVEAGDVAILPAGAGHKCVEASPDFLVVGAYPAGLEDYDLLRGTPRSRPQPGSKSPACPAGVRPGLRSRGAAAETLDAGMSVGLFAAPPPEVSRPSRPHSEIGVVKW